MKIETSGFSSGDIVGIILAWIFGVPLLYFIGVFAILHFYKKRKEKYMDKPKFP